jgi:heme exporter protein C
MDTHAKNRFPTAAVAGALVAGLMLTAILAIFLLAPTEETMGDVQRILYVHVASAWCALATFLVAAVAGVLYLMRRELGYDHWAQAAGELSWLGCGLTLVTGSLWARAAWGVWWTWDPRLTSTFVLWTIASAYLLVRSGVDDPHRRARAGAVLAVLGALDVPLVVVAARWFRGVHPAAPEMDPRMRLPLLASVVAFSVLYVFLVAHRRGLLRLEARLDAWEAAADQRQAAQGGAALPRLDPRQRRHLQEKELPWVRS